MVKKINPREEQRLAGLNTPKGGFWDMSTLNRVRGDSTTRVRTPSVRYSNNSTNITTSQKKKLNLTKVASNRVVKQNVPKTPKPRTQTIINNDTIIDNNGDSNLNVFREYILRRTRNINNNNNNILSDEILFREQTLFYVVNRIQVAVDQLHDISRITDLNVQKAVTRSIIIAMYDSIITYIINNGFLNYANQIISASLGANTQFTGIRARNDKDSENALELFRKKYGPKERYTGVNKKGEKLYPVLGNNIFSVIMFLFGREFGETSYRPWFINKTLIDLFAVFKDIPIQENKQLSLYKSNYVNKTVNYIRFIKDIDNIQNACLMLLGCKVVSSFEYSILMNDPSSSNNLINFLSLISNGIISRDLYITVDALQSSATWNSFSEIFRYYIFRASNPNKFKIYFVNSAAGLYDSASFNNVIYKYPEFVYSSGTKLTSNCWELNNIFIKFNNYRVNNTGEFNIYMEPYYILQEGNMLYDPAIKTKYDLLFSNNQFPRILNNISNTGIDDGGNRILFSGKLTITDDYRKARLLITKFFDIIKLTESNTTTRINNTNNIQEYSQITNNDTEEEIIIKLENNQKASLNVILNQADVKELINNVNNTIDISNSITDLVYYFAYKTMGDILKGFIHKTIHFGSSPGSSIFLTTDSYSSMFIKSFYNINTILGKRGNNSIVSTMNYILDNNNRNNNNQNINNNRMLEFGKKNFIINNESQKKEYSLRSVVYYCKRKLNVDKVNNLAKKSKNKKIRKKAVFAEYYSFGMNKKLNKLENIKKTLINMSP